MDRKAFFLCFVIAPVLVSGRRCYQCDTSGSVPVMIPGLPAIPTTKPKNHCKVVTSNELKECEPNEDKCAVIITTIELIPTIATEVLTRTCLTSPNAPNCIETNDTKACSCNTDGCNNAVTLPSISTTLLPSTTPITTSTDQTSTTGGPPSTVTSSTPAMTSQTVGATTTPTSGATRWSGSAVLVMLTIALTFLGGMVV